MRFSSVAENSKKMSRSKEPMGLASCALADKPRAACRAKPTEAFVPDGEEDRGLGKLGGERSHGVQSGECRVQNEESEPAPGFTLHSALRKLGWPNGFAPIPAPSRGAMLLLHHDHH